MKVTKTALIAEIVGLLLVVAVIEWLSTVFLNTRAFWPLMIYVSIYLGIRATLLARRMRNVKER